MTFLEFAGEHPILAVVFALIASATVVSVAAALSGRSVR